MKTCGNIVYLGQSGNVKCGTLWGETPILCDECKLKIKLIQSIDQSLDGLMLMKKPPVMFTQSQREEIKRIIEQS